MEFSLSCAPETDSFNYWIVTSRRLPQNHVMGARATVSEVLLNNAGVLIVAGPFSSNLYAEQILAASNE